MPQRCRAEVVVSDVFLAAGLRVALLFPHVAGPLCHQAGCRSLAAVSPSAFEGLTQLVPVPRALHGTRGRALLTVHSLLRSPAACQEALAGSWISSGVYWGTCAKCSDAGGW